jgi:tetratricopeptide (TPR) repeat protein
MVHSQAPSDRASSRLRAGVASALVLATLVAFGPVLGGGFLPYDDQNFILQNPRLQQGFTGESLAWTVTSTEARNWYPLTWLTHIADFSLHGKQPRGHHLTNLVLHAVNAAVLFLVLEALTGALWKSALVAAVFALHPVQVEPVAWIVQRKTLLSALFFLLTIDAWRRYVARPALGRYAAVFALLALALLSKPMAVTTPFVLLLLDAWPLGRLSPPAPPPPRSRRAGARQRETPGPSRGAVIGTFAAASRIEVGSRAHGARDLRGRLVAEKIPLLLLCAAASAVTAVAQRPTEMALAILPLGARIANAIHAYAVYLCKFLWPRDLAIFYPHPGAALGGAAVLGALLLLLAITAVAWRARARCPAALVGWLWFLGSLVPVIGIVQVGLQGMADRYLYTPMIGLAIMAAWGGEALLGRRLAPAARAAGFAGAFAAIVAVLGFLAWQQARLWRDPVALFAHTVRVTPPSRVTHRLLADAFMEKGRVDEAIAEYTESLRIGPNAETHYNLAEPLVARGRAAEAMAHYRAALRLDPGLAPARYNLAVLLIREGKFGEAESELREAIRRAPGLDAAHYALGNLLARQGRFADALPAFREAVRLRPSDPGRRLRLSRVEAILRGNGGAGGAAAPSRPAPAREESRP